MTLMVIFDKGIGYSGVGTAPDMGADEFSGLSDDQSAPAISYTILSNNSCTTGVLLPQLLMELELILRQQNHVFIIRNRPMPTRLLEVRRSQ
jgi:hypothetical protein